MSDRLTVAVAELVAALRDELASDLARDACAPERLYSVAEACALLGGISRPTLYAEIQAGRCRTLKIGGRRMVPGSSIAAYTGESR